MIFHILFLLTFYCIFYINQYRAYNNIQLSSYYDYINNFGKINDLSHTISSYVLLYFFTLMKLIKIYNYQFITIYK